MKSKTAWLTLFSLILFMVCVRPASAYVYFPQTGNNTLKLTWNIPIKIGDVVTVDYLPGSQFNSGALLVNGLSTGASGTLNRTSIKVTMTKDSNSLLVVVSGDNSVKATYYNVKVNDVDANTLDVGLPDLPVLTLVDSGSNFLSLSWTGSANNYAVVVNDAEVITTNNKFYTVNYLKAQTTYTVKIKAIDQYNRIFYSSPKTFITLKEDPTLYTIENLKAVQISKDSFKVSFDSVKGTQLKLYHYYVDAVKVADTTLTSYTFQNIDPSKSHTYQVYAETVQGESYASDIKTFSFPLPDLTPPEQPAGLKVKPENFNALLTWTLNKDSDLAGYYVYLDNKQVSPILVTATQFYLTSLMPENDYKAHIVAVDTSGNISNASDPVTFTTLPVKVAPTLPPVLSVTGANKGALLSWSTTPNATSYNVYQDGKEIAEVFTNSLIVKGLQNGRSYNYQVNGVNEIGSSPKSNTVSITPDEKFIPDVTLSYGLKDISDSTSSWFGSIWWILAFIIAIPLSFWIGRNIKTLFGGA